MTAEDVGEMVSATGNIPLQGHFSRVCTCTFGGEGAWTIGHTCMYIYTWGIPIWHGKHKHRGCLCLGQHLCTGRPIKGGIL